MAEPVEAERVLELLRDVNTLKREESRAVQECDAANRRLSDIREQGRRARTELAKLLGQMDITLPREDGGA